MKWIGTFSAGFAASFSRNFAHSWYLQPANSAQGPYHKHHSASRGLHARIYWQMSSCNKIHMIQDYASLAEVGCAEQHANLAAADVLCYNLQGTHQGKKLHTWSGKSTMLWNLSSLRLLQLLQETELVAAGFPCIDVSRAGQRKGLEGQVRLTTWHWLQSDDRIKSGTLQSKWTSWLSGL